MPKLFITGIVLFLLLGAGYGALQAARAIPWDCADWQAFAHEDRTTSILESLAENRGKTLYCGIDQSDTFAKAETWAAGKDRNERDNTVYYGERGHFRGFIAAQEGWLTEGESGITGQSIATIFEFPKEERQRRRKKREYLRDAVGLPPYHYSWYYGPERSSTTSQAAANTAALAALRSNLPTEAELIRYVRSSRADFLASLPSDAERERYRQIGARLSATLGGGPGEGSNTYYNGNAQLANLYDGLDAFCRSLEYQRAVNVKPNWGIYSNTYVEWTTTSPTTYHSMARRGVNYPEPNRVDCVRIKK